MADVNRGPGRTNRDRGQLILVTGLAVAVTLVALVLLLNTAIYTQNLATRGPAVEDSEAVTFRQEAIEGVGAVVDAENREEYDSASKVEENVTAGVSRFDTFLSRYHAESTAVADVEEKSLALTEGTLLRQTNASRNFSNVDDEPTWTAAGNVESARGFRLTVSEENLTDDSSPSGFSVRLVGNDGSVWQAFIYDDSDTDADSYQGITVAVKEDGGSATEVCSVSRSEATVDLTAGTINGTDCSGLDYAADIDAPYTVEFRDGGQATGAYELTVGKPPSDPDVKTGNFAGSDAEESPRAVPAVYAAEFDIHYETPNLAFHTTVRVAPGESE